MADYNTEQFEKDCKALGVTLSDEQIQQFLKYYEMLVEWNEVMNLTGIRRSYEKTFCGQHIPLQSL